MHTRLSIPLFMSYYFSVGVTTTTFSSVSLPARVPYELQRQTNETLCMCIVFAVVQRRESGVISREQKRQENKRPEPCRWRV